MPPVRYAKIRYKNGKSSISTVFAAVDQPGEMGKRAVIGPLGLWRKETARQFACPEMVADTIAADSPAGTRRIGTGTIFEILSLFAVHDTPFDKEAEASLRGGGTPTYPSLPGKDGIVR